MNVTFIGLGIMGSRMAANLQRAGYNLAVHNRTQSKADALVEAGATWADSPAEAVQDADIVITMLPTPEIVNEVATGQEGFLGAMKAGALWVDSSTLNPTVSKKFAEEARTRGVRFLDAPVSGSKGPAEAGELTFLVGGDEAALEEAKPLFDAMGKETVYAGGHGMGTSLKVVINHMLASSMAVFAEGAVLGEALGLSRKQLFDVLIGGPVTPPYLTGKREKFTSGDYAPEFPLQWAHKDMDMVATAAYEAGVPMPVANLVKEQYQRAVQAGWGEKDFSALYGYLEDNQQS